MKDDIPEEKMDHDDIHKFGLIFDIQRFAVHDGPGIRDLIFMKGCPLRCRWCSNPESHNDFPEVSYNHDRCIGWNECGRCLEACPIGAVTKVFTGKVTIDRQLCTNCGKCAEVCSAKALHLLGEFLSIDVVVKIIEEDTPFYSRSGGGITVGGGDPLSQVDFVHELLKECQGRGIDTAIETAGYGRWRDVEKICRYANLVFYDIKCLDSEKHKIFTGVPNELILENLKKISLYFPQIQIIVRTPVIPGFNDSAEEVLAVVNFLKNIENLKGYELLPYHGFGEPKYSRLGREYRCNGLKPPPPEQMHFLKSIADKLGVNPVG